MTELSNLLAVLAHEMRTPIAAILGYQELLAEGIYGKVDERGQEPLDRIAYSAKQLLHLIDGVQEISSPESKRLSVHAESFEPIPILEKCVTNAHADAHGRSVKITVDFPEALPQLNGDPDRFCRAVDLALAAAIKTSHGSTLPVRARANDEEIVITIEHSGLAPERDAPAATANGNLTGAGLRLAIVREIARAMQGDVELIPDDIGTTVTVRFPLPSS